MSLTALTSKAVQSGPVVLSGWALFPLLSLEQLKNGNCVTSLEVQWLRLRTSNAGDVSLIPGQGTKIPHASVVWPKHFFF